MGKLKDLRIEKLGTIKSFSGGYLMKKKYIIAALLVIGIILVFTGIVLAVIATGNKDIIGGADFQTFKFVFKYENEGLYSTLTFWGFVAIIASIVGMVIKKRT